ncbi:MAG: UDP-N-acetylmuramoyl-tripeptide--D-alanyl-D-alanine ligase [Victivallales bacterium]|nr:UDP-N-acetylmuramoyl-tripeptide--D-alanyl-D-alanine ligase [Victivallales bacterium]
MAEFSVNEIITAINGVLLYGKTSDIKVSGIVTDSRRDCSNALFIPIRGEVFDGHDFLETAANMGAPVILVEHQKEVPESVRTRCIVIGVDDTTRAYQALANFHRRRFTDLKIVAVTGSSGKTSTKEMLRSIFSAAYGADAVLATEGNTNNQIGVPQNLLRLDKQHKVAVIEMGTNHHGEIEPLSLTTEPDVSVISFIGSCHLEFLGSIEGVAREKSCIFAGLKPGGTAVIPVSGGGQDILEKKAASYKVIHFAGNHDADVSSRYLGGTLQGSQMKLKFRQTGEEFLVNWKLSGRHQASNAAAAAAAASAMGINGDKIVQGLEQCVLPGMRMKITEREGVTWVNDAYNANPDSVKASLEWLAEFIQPENFVLILGDMLEIGENSVNEQLKVLKQALVLFPSARIAAVGKEMCKASGQLNNSETSAVMFFSDSTCAVEPLGKVIKPGDTVFLKASRGIKLEIVEQSL